MSLANRRHEAERWLATAEEDLQAAQVLMQAGAHAQACFYTQQAGEKAVKSLWYSIDADPWGHSVQKLIVDFPRPNDLPNRSKWIEWSRLLDKFYIPTRYPNGLPDLTPGQVYAHDDAQRGVDAATALVAACRAWFAQNG